PVFVPEARIKQINPDAVELDDAETAQQLLLKPRICLEGRTDSCSDTWRTPDDFRQLLACYYIVIEMIDEQIGRVLDELEALVSPTTPRSRSVRTTATWRGGDESSTSACTPVRWT
ncbi:MAG: hypothetical protein ACOC0P_03125, partial [Planctomycetota bacterium]